jgi:ABC-type sugar transport system permease subunit
MEWLRERLGPLWWLRVILFFVFNFFLIAGAVYFAIQGEWLWVIVALFLLLAVNWVLFSPTAFERHGAGWWVRAVCLGLLDGVVLVVAVDLIDQNNWIAAISVLIGTAGVNFIFFSSRTYPIRWLVPGMTFLILLMVWPIIYTVFIALTNWSTGNFITKDQALERITEGPRYLVDEESLEAGVLFYLDPEEADPTGLDELAGLNMGALTEDGEFWFGVPRLASDPPPEETETTNDLSEFDPVEEGPDGLPSRIGPYERLLLVDIGKIDQVIDDLVLDVPDQGAVQVVTFSSGIQAVQRFVYDEERDVLLDRDSDGVCPIGTEENLATLGLSAPEVALYEGRPGNFVCAGPELIEPGWRTFIGLENFSVFLTDSRVRGPFLRIFAWNVVFALSVVIIQLVIGMGLAITFNDDRMKGKRTLRSLLIIPYAIPVFISAIVWRGLLNPTFGLINRFLAAIIPWVDEVTIPWVQPGDPFWSKIAVIIVTCWVGFAYFFLITTGALQSIPSELTQAARVDGASGFQVFRKITFPLLMVGIAPLLIASFAFNFNAFTNIFLVTQGGPPVTGQAVPYGETDILISFVFDLAVEGGRGGQFALAAAATFYIFIIVALIAAFSFRFTRRLETIYGNI